MDDGVICIDPENGEPISVCVVVQDEDWTHRVLFTGRFSQAMDDDEPPVTAPAILHRQRVDATLRVREWR